MRGPCCRNRAIVLGCLYTHAGRRPKLQPTINLLFKPRNESIHKSEISRLKQFFPPKPLFHMACFQFTIAHCMIAVNHPGSGSNCCRTLAPLSCTMFEETNVGRNRYR